MEVFRDSEVIEVTFTPPIDVTVLNPEDITGAGTTTPPLGNGIIGWLQSIWGFFRLGQGTMAQSLAVTVASNQTAFPVTIQAGTTSTFTNFGANATLNIKASSAKVLSISCFNKNALENRYFQLHNTATVPTAGNVPRISFLVPANSQIVIGDDFFTKNGLDFSTGVAFAFSTTSDTYTAGTAANQSTIVNYI